MWRACSVHPGPGREVGHDSNAEEIGATIGVAAVIHAIGRSMKMSKVPRVSAQAKARLKKIVFLAGT